MNPYADSSTQKLIRSGDVQALFALLRQRNARLRALECSIDFSNGVRGKYAGRFTVNAPVTFINDEET